MATKLDKLLYQASRLGWAGAAGIALIAIAVFIEAGLSRPMTLERDALSERIDQAILAKQKANAEAEAVSAQPDAELPDSAAATLRHLFEAAKSAGLSLEQGDYQFARDKEGARARFLLALPVHGSYPAIRGFVAQMLNEDPALALASLDMSRGAIAETQLDATLHFVLYLKDER